MAVASITKADCLQWLKDASAGSSSPQDIRMYEDVIRDAMDMIYDLYDWPWWRTVVSIETVGARLLTLNAALAPGDTAVVMDTSMPDLAGRFIEFDNNNVLQEIKSSSTVNVTLSKPYTGVDLEAGDTGWIHKPSYDLPEEFDKLISLEVSGDNPRPIKPISVEQYQALLYGIDHTTGNIVAGFVGTIDTDGRAGFAAPRLWLYPMPIGRAIGDDDPDDTPQVVRVTFFRRWGWRVSNVWQQESTLSTDVLDFPYKHTGILRAALRLCLARNRGTDPTAPEREFGQKVAAAMSSANESDGVHVLRRNTIQSGMSLEESCVWDNAPYLGSERI